MKTNRKGISLIVLIITILVMIIIAAAVILYLDDEKIISNAERAVTENDIQVAKELLVVARTEWRTKGDEIDKTLYPTLQAYGEHKLEEAGFEIGYTQGKVVVLENGLLHTNKTPLVPEGYIASDLENEDEIEEGFVIYEGTEKVSTDADAQETRNQFVWIPVPEITDFVRKEWNQGHTIDETISYKLSSEKEKKAYEDMIESVKKYGGFYIGRYEMGKDSSGNKVIRKNKEPCNYANISSAVNYSSKLTSNSVVGHAVYGEEWDAALTFILKSDPDYIKNSIVRGNCSGSTILMTGINKEDVASNIHDLCGNLSEVTQEYRLNENTPVFRGGSTFDSGSRFVSHRGFGGSALGVSESLGIRSALYIK